MSLAFENFPTPTPGIPPASTAPQLSFFGKLKYTANTRYQRFLDLVHPYKLYRWIAFFLLSVLYLARVFSIEGFYIVTYALGIFWLNQLIAFLTPHVDPKGSTSFEASDSESPSLPVKISDEFKPFIRRLPEFKFW